MENKNRELLRMLLSKCGNCGLQTCNRRRRCRRRKSRKRRRRRRRRRRRKSRKEKKKRITKMKYKEVVRANYYTVPSAPSLISI